MTLIDDVLLPASLWAIMFSMGLSLTLTDFKRIAQNRRALYVGMGSMLIIPPAIGLVLVLLFAPTPELAVGFILLATCPGGMLSNLMTDMAEGDLALSLSLSILVSMIYIVLVPFYAHFALINFIGVAEQVNVPLVDFIWKIFRITLIPASIGIIVRHYQPELALRAKGAVKLIGTGVLVIAFGFILVDQLPVLKEHFNSLFAITLGMNLLNLAVALMLATIFAVNAPERVAIGIEHLIRQEGTAIYIAVSIVGSREMSLPMIMNTPVALALCIIFVLYSRRALTAHYD